MFRIKSWLAILLLSSVLLGGCAADTGKLPADNSKPTTAPTAEHKDNSVQPPNNGQNVPNMQLTIYFASQDGRYIVPQIYTVAKNDQPLKTAVEMLLAGPKSTEVLPVFPNEVKLKNITVKDHIAYVDFNDKLIKNKVGGSAGEMLLVGALVDTLTEFPNVKKVQILVEGKKIETISGHMDTSEPIGHMEQMIKR